MTTTKKKPLKKKLTEAQVNALIEKSNLEFKNATPALRRVMIAEDVISLIQSKVIRPKHGTWLQIADKHFDEVNKKSLQKEILSGNIAKCECCGLGAMFVACSVKNNKTLVDAAEWDNLGGDIEDKTRLSNKLNTIFSYSQLSLIEIAFETRAGFFYNSDANNDDVYANADRIESARTRAVDACAEKFGAKYRSASDRLIAIMKNIIANNGQFKP